MSALRRATCWIYLLRGVQSEGEHHGGQHPSTSQAEARGMTVIPDARRRAIIDQPTFGIHGVSGSFTDVTPADLSLATNVTGAPHYSGHSGGGSIDAYGVSGPVANPVIAGKGYGAADNQGIWRTDNFGESFTHVNTGTGGSDLDGFSWSISVASDGSFILANNGYGTVPGIYKSTDDAVSWRNVFGGDVNRIVCNPFDPLHAIALPHGSFGDDHFYETTDGGETWNDIGNNAVGVYGDGWFISLNTYMVISPNGLFRCHRTAGTWAYTLITSPDLDTPHGGIQMCLAPDGYFYLGGLDTADSRGKIFRSNDDGVTFAVVDDTLGGGNFGPDTIWATLTKIYAMGSFATHTTTASPYGPLGRIADVSNGSSFSPFATPSMVHNGPFGTAVWTDGTRFCFVMACVNAGFIRYVE